MMRNLLQQYPFVCLIFVLAAMLATAAAQDNNEEPEYMMIGVSGGLQEGFPAHDKLHYQRHDYATGETVIRTRAIFLGRGLVRGYKAFLDLMQQGWREYETAENAVINPNVIATGCYEHANEYWIYLVDARHVVSILNDEPRHLALTPDTGLIELDAAETTPVVRRFLRHVLHMPELQRVAIPLVTAVYFNPQSLIPSPPIRVHDDGTHVTNFPDSLALWARVDDHDRTQIVEYERKCRRDKSQCDRSLHIQAQVAHARYWKGIRQAIAEAEETRESIELENAIPGHGPPFDCQRRVQFGVGKEEHDQYNPQTIESMRLNKPLQKFEVESTLHVVDYETNFQEGYIWHMRPGREEL